MIETFPCRNALNTLLPEVVMVLTAQAARSVAGGKAVQPVLQMRAIAIEPLGNQSIGLSGLQRCTGCTTVS
ncbi:hypothetical protein PpSQ1_03030 [Pseudomonas putida]|nr:hypothetical protein PpSQ1_03030 [Pseudomonas putida]